MDSLLVLMSSLYADEAWAPEGARVCDLRHLESTCCYCESEAEKEIAEVFGKLPLKVVHWIDGGDFHYLSDIWMRSLQEKARLVLFDNHPADQEPAFGADILSCGSWVAHSRRCNPLLVPESDNIYLSIDLDYLSPDYARTNWNQGTATLQDLLHQIDGSIHGKNLLGVDICGGITASQGGTAEDFSINRRTRDTLLEYFKAI